MSVIETTIEGRYQVITRVASGGMGEVFRAHDAVLARDVAVKVLHPHFAGDRGFVDRFRREARAAAILNHPSIVGVYDWGSTDGTYFMVMEFVAGVNLRALLAEHGRLEPAQVLEICLPVLDALDHAHGHGIVHRDVKPENILISRDGTVKVADFGLARAYAESSISQAEGTVTGTVQYLAPEQIQGERADPRTDLYALGIVMYELLTGEAPFSGETALGIAYQHLSGRVPAPSSLQPAVPASLDRAVLWATEKDRDRRPPSAREFADEVRRATAEAPSAPPIRDLATQIPPRDLAPADRATTVTIPRSMSPRARRFRLVRRIALVLIILAALAAGAWAGREYLIPTYTGVPRVVGMTIEQAEQRLRAGGLSVRVGQGVFSSTVEPGVVVESRPPPGTRVREGSEVVLIPSLGPELIPVPEVAGLKEDDARQALRDEGFVPQIERAYDGEVRRGRVIRQSPGPGVELERGSTVTITVSRGKPPVPIPNVRGEPADQAEAVLKAAGLQVKREERFSDDVPEGNVINTEPPAGTEVKRGTAVTMIVSLGPEEFPMPNVLGMDVDEAKALLEGMGLHVDVQNIAGFGGNTVVLQSPRPGVEVRRGDTVFIHH